MVLLSLKWGSVSIRFPFSFSFSFPFVFRGSFAPPPLVVNSVGVPIDVCGKHFPEVILSVVGAPTDGVSCVELLLAVPRD